MCLFYGGKMEEGGMRKAPRRLRDEGEDGALGHGAAMFRGIEKKVRSV